MLPWVGQPVTSGSLGSFGLGKPYTVVMSSFEGILQRYTKTEIKTVCPQLWTLRNSPSSGFLFYFVTSNCVSWAFLLAQWQRICLQCRRCWFYPWVKEGGNGKPLQHSCLGNQSYGQRSLAGFSLRGHQESDMTEQLTLSLSDGWVTNIQRILFPHKWNDGVELGAIF